MEEKLSTTRHFFKVMMPGFEENLSLPLMFCEKLKQEKSTRAIIRSRKGRWKISVCRNSEGLICFKDGWPNFVHNHGLSIGDFVLFEHIGDLNFNAFVFDPTVCEKEFLVEIEKESQEEPQQVNTNDQPRNTKRELAKESYISSNHSQNPHFIVTMKPFHAQKRGLVASIVEQIIHQKKKKESCVGKTTSDCLCSLACKFQTTPAYIWRTNNLRKKSGVTLRDPHGRTWPVNLNIQRSVQFQRRMDGGWHDFYVSNKLKDGDNCVFKLKSTFTPIKNCSNGRADYSCSPSGTCL